MGPFNITLKIFVFPLVKVNPVFPSGEPSSIGSLVPFSQNISIMTLEVVLEFSSLPVLTRIFHSDSGRMNECMDEWRNE